MEGIIRVASHRDPMLTILSYKIINHGLNVVGGVYKYENDECLHMILDNLLIYIKSVIRFMAQSKRKFKIACPLLTQKDGNKTEKTSKDSMNKEGRQRKVKGNKRLMPWQIELDSKKINMEDSDIFEENNLKDMEEKGRQDERILNSNMGEPQSPRHEECMDIGTEADRCEPSTSREGMDIDWEVKGLETSTQTSEEDLNAYREVFIDEDETEDRCKDTTEENRGNEINKSDEKEVESDEGNEGDKEDEDDNKANKDDDDDDNKRDEDDNKGDKENEDDNKEDKSDVEENKKNTVEYIIPEVIYSRGSFDIRDLLQLLMENSHIIPKRSLYQVSVLRVLSKVDPTLAGIIVGGSFA